MDAVSGVLPQLDDPDVDRVVARIDAAVREAASDQARFIEAWRDTFSLPYWYFLAQRDAEGQDSLYVGTVGGRPHIAGFTTARRLRDFAIRDLGVVTEDQIAPAAVLTPRGFVEIAEAYAERGLDGIAFDHGINGHFTALTNLKPLWEHCFGVPFDTATDSKPMDTFVPTADSRPVDAFDTQQFSAIPFDAESTTPNLRPTPYRR